MDDRSQLEHAAYNPFSSYRDIAEYIGAPRASRAVGRACATNPASIVIPCHRALGSDDR